MILSRDQNAWRSHSIRTDNSSLESVEQFKYLGTTLTNHILFRKKLRADLEPGNACYHSVQNMLSFSLLSRNIKIKIYRTIILSVVLCVCEIWSLTLTQNHRLRVFENRMLRRIFDPKREDLTGKWRKIYNWELLFSAPHQILFGWSNRKEWDGWGM